jgi:hypothetical protein
MGRDLTLYPKKATKQELKLYLEGVGFQRCGHFGNWPAGTLNYSWFDHEDFKSIDGVSADIFPVSDEKLKISGNSWALHVRNLYSACWHDVKMLNDVLRGARKLFGGTIKGDYGTNKYAPLWKDDSTPISRGVAAIYGHVSQELSAVKLALPAPSMQPPLLEGTDERSRDFVEFTKSLDPSRVIYNGLVPFAVAMFEYFFSRVFRVLITYDDVACKKKQSHNAKVDFSTLLEVSAGQRSVEDVITSSYTFQNLSQLNNAYKEWLAIDVRKVLYRRARIGRTVTFLEHRISEIIQYRHGIVHHFEIDKSLTREGYLEILVAVKRAISEFIKFLEAKYAVKMERW